MCVSDSIPNVFQSGTATSGNSTCQRVRQHTTASVNNNVTTAPICDVLMKIGLIVTSGCASTGSLTIRMNSRLHRLPRAVTGCRTTVARKSACPNALNPWYSKSMFA